MIVLRDYDEAFMAKLGAAVDAPAGKGYWATVPTIANKVPVGFGLPTEWWVDLGFPSMNVTRLGPVPAPDMMLPGFVGTAPDPADPTNRIEVQDDRSIPYRILYQLELAADSQTAAQAMLSHVALVLPGLTYGSFLTLYGTKTRPYRQTDFRDRTKYESKEGRVYRYVFTYAVEAWMADTAATSVPNVQTVTAPVTVDETL